MSALFDFALAYVRLGLHVFPLRPGEKVPLTQHGVLDASADEDQIRQWWQQWPDANIGIACGASGLCVIDIDPDKEGDETWARLRDAYDIPDETWTQLTGGGGTHLIYRIPDGVEIRNNTGKLGPGLDVRGNGGYFVVAPSIHPSGKLYVWEVGFSPGDIEPLELPQSLVQLLQGPGERRRVFSSNGVIREGVRNDTLFRMACAMRRWGASQETIEEALLRENVARCVPPLPEKEVKSIAASAGRYEPAERISGSSIELYNLTDLGNAERLVMHFGEDIRYCFQWEKWLVWNGKYWEVDDSGKVHRMAHTVVRFIKDEAWEVEDEEQQQAILKHAHRSEANARINAMLDIAKSLVPIQSNELDTHPWWLNVENGILDLTSGDLLPHKREAFITKIAPVPYDPQAVAPNWERFLSHILDNNVEMLGFLRRSIGYALTGDVSEQCMFILYGVGANGKSTFLETMAAVLGDYHLKTPTKTLLLQTADSIPNDIARLRGARFVTAIEVEEGRRLSESIVKQMTGGDTLVARFLRAEYFEFKPTFKLFMATNHKPVIRGTDHAIWRRIHLIPFTVVIPPDKQDKALPERLQEERSGILNWALQGCLDWQQEGLIIPRTVQDATKEYRSEMDILESFLRRCCIFEMDAKVKASDLYKAYTKWAEDNNEYKMSSTMFGRRMADRNFRKVRESTGYVYVGIGLLQEETWS